MSKSKYPENFDTSIEIPAVRDSVISETVNGLRSAVFQIERVLGINPQGSAGGNLASRLNKSLDSNGNILPGALVNAGLLTGPIENKDISESAAISEKKLNLDYSTQLLQNEITILESQLNTIIKQLTEFSSRLAIHLSKDNSNSHPAKSISVETQKFTEDDSATLSLDSVNVQEALEKLYSGHINYSGQNISSSNNSHHANQIFFDNSNISGVITANDVQGAIEGFITSNSDENTIHQDVQHSNGLLRFGKLRTLADEKISQIIASNISVSFSSSNGNSEGSTTIIINDIVSNLDLKPFDIVQIVDSTDSDRIFTGEYEIKSFQENNGRLVSIDIFGLLKSSSTANTTINLTKNIEAPTNEAALLVSATEESGLTSSRFLQVANPDCVRIISQNINPFNITSTNRYFTLTIDNVDYLLDTFNATLNRQSLDSIVARINKQLVSNAAQAKAYRLDFEDGRSELALIHDIPDDLSETHTLKVSRGSDDALDTLGLSHLEGLEQVALIGTKYFINGQTFSGLSEKLDSTELSFFSNSNNIGVGLSSIDFLNSNIKIGDIVIITGAQNSNDNGSYFIESVSESQIRISSKQLPSGFAGSSTEQTRFRIFSNSISSQNITFDKVNGTFGSAILDIFMDKNREIHFNKILEYASEIVGSTSIIEIVDLDGKDFFDEVLTLNLEEDPDDVNSFYLSLDNSDSLKISGLNNYIWVTSGNKNIKLKFYIPDASIAAGKIASNSGEINIPIYLFQSLNLETNMPLSRVLYNSFNGRFSGGIGAARCLRKVPFGTLSEKDLGSTAKEELIEKPISELRYNGVINGFEIENALINSDGFYTFNLKRGLGYINGKRIYQNTTEDIVTDINSASYDKVYIILDENGNYRFDTSLSTNCTAPYGESDFLILGCIEYDGTNLEVIDLRLFIDHLDLKILNSITVSPQSGMAHFKDPVKALKYAKRFSEIFPNAGTPSVHFKSGIHTITLDYDFNENSASWDFSNPATLEMYYNKQIESGFFIDFPVTIEGEGSSTVIELKSNLNFLDTNYTVSMPLSIIGSGFSAATKGHQKLETGGFVEVKNLTLKNTRISILDFNLIKDTENLSCEVKIDNVYFDFNNFNNTFIDNTLGPRAIELREISDSTTDKGSVTIVGCTFLNSGIHADGIERIKNITISDCTIINDSDLGFLFQDLYSFSTATSGSNINITNNRYNNNTNPGDASGPEIIDGDSLGWGDRLDRDIQVGGDGKFNNNIIVNNNAISNSFSYANTKTATQIFTWDMFNATNGQFFGGGNADLSSATFSVKDDNGRWLVCNIGTGNNHGFMKIYAPVGSRITKIDLGVDSGGYDWSLSIHEQRIDGLIRILARNYGPITSIPLGSFEVATFENINLTIDSDTIYTVEISHDHSSSVAHFYTKIYYEFTTIEDALGVEA